jgi:hypothetical protein
MVVLVVLVAMVVDRLQAAEQRAGQVADTSWHPDNSNCCVGPVCACLCFHRS